jgi:hypothetical protein
VFVLECYGYNVTIAILRSLALRDNSRALTARIEISVQRAGWIVRIHLGRVNRTALCNKSEKWKSRSAKKRRPEFRDAQFSSDA